MGCVVVIVVLVFIILAISYPVLWIVAGIFVAGIYLFSWINKKQNGHIEVTAGLVNGVKSTIHLYPDKLTINKIQIIAIERVKKSYVFNQKKSKYIGSGIRRNILIKNLFIEYVSINGRDEILRISSRADAFVEGEDYRSFSKKINKLIDYDSDDKIIEPYEI